MVVDYTLANESDRDAEVVLGAAALVASSFSSPLLSAVFAFSLFMIGTFSEDLRAFAGRGLVATEALPGDRLFSGEFEADEMGIGCFLVVMEEVDAAG